MYFRIDATFNKPLNYSMGFRDNIRFILGATNEIRKTDKFSQQWYLMGKTKEESYQYVAIDEKNELTTSSEAVLNTRFKNKQESKYFSVWNGELEYENSGGISLHFNSDDWPKWNFIIEYPNETKIERFGGINGVISLVNIIAKDIKPILITTYMMSYDDAKVFKDRPGVGWMLYLPKILTAAQVPEAAELIPVMGSENRQFGTIIVSTIEEFSDENPDHIKKANAIEIRLVDQDLLPRYMDL